MEAKWIAIGTIIGIIVLVGVVVWAENAQNPIWNVLRPIENASESIHLVTTLIVFLLSAAMLALALKAYQRSPSNRFLFVSLAFGIMMAKFLVKLIDAAYSPGHFFSQASQNVFDFFVLVALLVSLLKKN